MVTTYLALICAVILFDITSGQLECLRCKHITHQSSNQLIQGVLEGHRNPECANELLDATSSSVDVEACPSGDVQMIYKCGYLTGNVIGTLFSINVNMTIFDRGCIGVETTATPGCVPRRNVREDIFTLQTVLGFLQSFNIQSFVGERCLCDGNVCSFVSGSSMLQLSLSLLTCVIFTFALLV